MTLLVLLLVAWLLVSPVVALVFGAVIRAGEDAALEAPLRLLPAVDDASRDDRGPRAGTSPLEDLAA